jgi:transposase InsO family protein
LRDAIDQIVLAFPGYGYRRVTKALERAGWKVNHKRVRRVLRQACLLCQLKRAVVRPTDAAHAYQTYPNLLVNLELTGLDQAWVADITYIRLPTTFVYLAYVLDAYSRRCVGWHLSRDIDTQLTLAALEQALGTRCPSARADSSFGSWGAIGQCRLCDPSRAGGLADQYVGNRQSV